MAKAFFALALLLVVLSLVSCSESEFGDAALAFPGETRIVGANSYQLYIPNSVNPQAPTAVVISMHGTGGHGNQELARWSALADAEGFVVMAPNYVDNNTYFDIGGNAIIAAMLQDLSQEVAIGDVYAAGFSTGATWSFLYGLENAQQVEGVICVAGGYTGANDLVVAGAQPPNDTPFYLVHGVADGTLPVDNARDARDALQTAGFPVMLEEHNGGHTIPAGAVARAWNFVK